MRGLGARVLAALRACGLGPRLLTGFLLVALLPLQKKKLLLT